MEWLSDWSTLWKIALSVGTALGVFPTPKRSVLRGLWRWALWHTQREKKLIDQQLEIARLQLRNRSLEESNESWARDYSAMVQEMERANQRAGQLASSLGSAVSVIAPMAGSSTPPPVIPTIPEPVPANSATNSTGT